MLLTQLAVHRHGTHAAAGRALKVAPTTVARRLAALEEALGARLLVRIPSGLVLSDAGQMLRTRAERMEAEVVASERELAGGDQRVAGRVRLTLPDGLATWVVAPRLPELQAAHPSLELELRVDNRSLDLSRREADVALRVFRPQEPLLVARRLVALPYGLYASEAYLTRRGRPSGVRDLEAHDWLVPDDAQDGSPARTWLQRHVPRARLVLRASSTTVLMAACAAGGGLALLPAQVAEHEPQLLPLLARAALPHRELWAVTHQDLRKSARVASVLAWLERLFTDATGGRAPFRA